MKTEGFIERFPEVVENVVADPLDAVAADFTAPGRYSDICVRVHLSIRRPTHLNN